MTDPLAHSGQTDGAAAHPQRQLRMLQAVVNSTPDFVYVFSLDHRVLYANDALVAMWGHGRDGTLGKTFAELGYEPWHAEQHAREIDQVRATRQPLRGEVPFTGTAGRRLYDYLFVPIFGPDGAVEAVAGITRDVTDRRADDRRLRNGQEQLDFALAAAGLWPWSLDLATLHFTRPPLPDDPDRPDGLESPEGPDEPWTYARFLAQLLPADRAALDASLRAAVAGGTAWSAEGRIRRPDGALRHIWIQGIVHRGAHGEPDRLLGILGDITERREAEDRQAFRVALADALRPLSDPVEVQAVAGRMLGPHLGANRVAYFEIRGDEYVVERDFTVGVPSLAGRYPVASFGPALHDALLAGRTLVEADATAEHDRPAHVRSAFAALRVRGHVDVPLVKGGRFVAGLTVQTAERRAWTAAEVALVEETAERTWAAVEKARAEAELRLSEERLAFVRRSSGVGFWYCDLPFDVLQWDDLVKEHFHLPHDAVVTIDTFYERMHPDDREPTRVAIERSIADHQHYDTQYRTVHPASGAVKWVRAIGRTFYADDGSAIRFDGVTLDVTEQKQAEAQLREADRRKDEFLAILAHELRNPLAPIRSGLQVMRAAGTDGPLEAVRAVMERQLVQLTRLVDDLLDMSRLTTGKLELRPQPLALQAVVGAALETSRPVIEAAGHTLALDLPAAPVAVHGDPVRLAQVVSNLLINAAKYTPAGGHIRVALATEGDSARIAVADDGIGIPPGMLDGVFDMFTQVDRGLEKTSGGLGIGLSLVRRLVAMHGGRIAAHSAGEGRGAEFVVHLPLAGADADADVDAGADAAAAPGAPAAAAGTGGPRRFLVVDDNQDAANMLGELLEVMGHTVQVTYGGEAALAAGPGFAPDVVLCDIAMPGLNGYDTARRIRAEPWGVGPVLVAVSGFGHGDHPQRGIDAGFNHHLVKPLDVDVLMALLDAPGGSAPPRR